MILINLRIKMICTNDRDILFQITNILIKTKSFVLWLWVALKTLRLNIKCFEGKEKSVAQEVFTTLMIS